MSSPHHASPTDDAPPPPTPQPYDVAIDPPVVADHGPVDPPVAVAPVPVAPAPVAPATVDLKPVEPAPLAPRTAPVTERLVERAAPAAPLRPPVVARERLASLDIFRGITIAAMLLVNNPGTWGQQYGPLKHADWHGWTPTDLVFPFFLFIVGVAIPFSLAKRGSLGEQRKLPLLGGIWIRALSLVLLGLLLHGIPIWDAPLPEGYVTLKALRWVAAAFVAFGFVVLLYPWKSRRLAVGFPLLVAVLYVAIYWAITFANKSALNAGLPADFAFGSGLLTPYKLRFPGVLQRIGLCYGVAASIALFAGWRTILFSALALMAGYAALMLAVPYPGHVTGALEQTDNLARHVDVAVFRTHNYGSYPDPEGLISTLPAVASVLIGILVGLRLRRTDRPVVEKGASVLAWGVVVTCLGVLLSWWLMPINKPIWTPSFTVFTAGLGMLGLGAVFYAADVKQRRRWALPFTIYGMNAIAAFVLSGILNRLLGLVRFDNPRTPEPDVTTPLAFAKLEIAEGMHRLGAWVAQHAPALPPIDTSANVSLAYSIGYVLAILLLMTVLYVCRIFIKV